ncbi:MAG: hypothetical protein HeimC2_26210 [Candidatus Heimdallarchaeota archaeon LC_2]|nr:MAG: hypothetical protein HeimC2_26210 [Candidatus Heimdallarchaeota archaeon LC_2]
MSYQIPTIIPKYRFWGAFIALTISSAIFVSSFTLIFSLSNAGGDIFGTSDNILVYYDTRATTPFTSNVPEYLEKSFQQVLGVELVNPEIFQPVIIGKNTAYIRGTNISKLIDLENGKITEGKIPEIKQIYHALVGEGLSNRLNLNINDTITIESIVADQQIPIRIVGKYESGNLATTDEILVSKEIARAIAGDDEFTVTHIRVKFDPLVTTKEKIINEALKLYTINLDVNLGNNTVETNLYSIQIIDQANQIVFNSKVEASFLINLFKGTYIINVLRGTSIQSNQTLDLESDVNLSVDLLNYIFKFDAWINYKLVTLPEIKFEIRQTFSGILSESGFTDINGRISSVLPRNNYTINVFEGTNIIIRTFILSKPIKMDIDVDSFETISFENMKNGTLITRNNFILTISNLPINLNLMVNNEIIHKSQGNKINNYQFSINIDNGIHEFSLIHLENLDKKLKSVILEIDSSIIQPQILEFQDGAHYEPSRQFNINTRGLSNGTLETTVGQLTYLNENVTIFELPNIEGFYNFTLFGVDIFGSKIQSNNKMIIENNPKTGGWKKHNPQPLVKAGDLLDVWTNTKYEGITVQNGSFEIDANQLNYVVPNFAPDNYSIEVFPQNADSFLLNFTIVDSYSSLFSVFDESSSVPLESGTIYNSSYITLTYLNQSSISFDRDWEVLINMGYGNFSLYSGQNVSIPGVLELIPSKIYIKSKITNTVEVVDVTFEDDPIPKQDYLNLIWGFPSRVLDGKIKSITPNGTILTYVILKNNDSYNPVELSNNLIQLGPGNYSAVFTNSIYSTLNWDFEVPFAKEIENTVNSVDVSYDWGIINNFSGELELGQVFINGTSFLVENTLDLNFDYFRNISNNSIELKLHNFIEGNITILYSNNTLIFSEVTSSIIYLSLNNIGGNTHVDISISSISLTGNPYEFSDTILLNMTEEEFTFSLNNASINIDLPYTFTLELFETREIINLSIDEFNTTFALSFLPQQNRLTISNSNGSLFNGGIDLFTSTSFTYFFGIPKINFKVANLNYQTNATDGVVSISLQGDDENEIEVSINDEIQLPIGIYNFVLKDGNFETSLTLGINNSQLIVASFDIREISTIIKINGLPFGDFTDFELRHQFISATHQQQVNTNENEVTIETFPYGPSILKLNGSWGTNEIKFNLIRPAISIDLVIEGSQNILSNIDFRFADKVANLQLGASVGGEYLDTFLAGSLLIARSIIITEIIIIFLIVITNVIEIFAAITYESKREIAILRNLGSTTFQTVIASTKFLLLNAFVISILGQLLGGIVIKFLLAGQYTVYFGHQFYPSLFVFEIFMANVSIVIFLTFLGAFYNVRKEYRSI